jgi:hypothetical protein
VGRRGAAHDWQLCAQRGGTVCTGGRVVTGSCCAALALRVSVWCELLLGVSSQSACREGHSRNKLCFVSL